MLYAQSKVMYIQINVGVGVVRLSTIFTVMHIWNRVHTFQPGTDNMHSLIRNTYAYVQRQHMVSVITATITYTTITKQKPTGDYVINNRL